jgi:hypothetical protein
MVPIKACALFFLKTFYFIHKILTNFNVSFLTNIFELAIIFLKLIANSFLYFPFLILILILIRISFMIIKIFKILFIFFL